jgi:hypothetical protein
VDTLTLAFNVVLTAVNIAVAVFQFWREWHTHLQPAAHPLEPALRDIAHAIRSGRAT